MIDPLKVLAGIPVGLREPLLATFREIDRNYIERRWEPSELNGGKFCEVVYSIVDGAIRGVFPASPSKPSNMVAACRALEASPANPVLAADHSLRILIPRMLLPLYDIRNNRGVGHIGGDVDPNFLDATAVYGMASWILAELVRIFHGVTTDEAQEAVDMLVERKIPLIWQIGDVRRVLSPKMPNTNQVLVLLNQQPAWVSEDALRDWVEHNDPAIFRRDVLKKLHTARLIEYDQPKSRARISPLGVAKVENEILKTAA